MSRLAQRTTQHARAAAPASAKTAAPPSDPQDEICPVCKTPRYLKTNLRLLINPECYHKMCESCVDRIFSNGPARCPVPGCGRTLRKAKFRMQTFEDIKVEKEVDIRRRTAAVFNKEEEDFEDLRSYNDYLNTAEDITFNLVNNIDYAKNMALLEQFEKASQPDRQQADTQTQAKVIQHKPGMQNMAERKRKLASGNAVSSDTDTTEPTALFKGLKPKKETVQVEIAPVDPFDGLHLSTRYFELQPSYTWEGIAEVTKDALVLAGGYDVADFAMRSLTEAYAGLGVVIRDELS